MKKVMLLAALAAMSITGSASALSFGPRLVTASGFPSGIINFYYWTNVPGPAGACQYYADWQSPFYTTGASVPCFLNEAKTLAYTSCFVNRITDFPTTVTSSYGACSGYDQTGIPQPVTLFLAETFGGVLTGLASYAGFPLFQSIDVR